MTLSPLILSPLKELSSPPPSTDSNDELSSLLASRNHERINSLKKTLFTSPHNSGSSPSDNNTTATHRSSPLYGDVIPANALSPQTSLDRYNDLHLTMTRIEVFFNAATAIPLFGAALAIARLVAGIIQVLTATFCWLHHRKTGNQKLATYCCQHIQHGTYNSLRALAEVIGSITMIAPFTIATLRLTSPGYLAKWLLPHLSYSKMNLSSSIKVVLYEQRVRSLVAK